MPRPDSYFEPINWHRTAFHELGHWTGHPARLGRDQSGDFGSKKYAQEDPLVQAVGLDMAAARQHLPLD